MRRGDLYRVYKGNENETKDFRVFVVVSRQVLIDSKFSTVICAPVYTNHDGLTTQVLIGSEFGLKKDSSIHFSDTKIQELDQAIKIALELII
jgi:mRNA interferase MazF